jgi:starvation-inducible DNA-binding protein
MAKITEASAAAQKRVQEKLVDEISRENSAGNLVVEQLQRQVANGFVLYMNYKHYHWQTYGPLFRDLHLLFDEFAKAVLATVDDFAERIRMIGQDPISTPEEIMKRTSVKIAERDQTLRQMIAEADRNLLTIIKEMRVAAGTADEQEDPGTVDLFSRHVQIHEKHEWWLRDILETRDQILD